MTVSEFKYTTDEGEVLIVPYLEPKDILETLLGKYPDAVLGEAVSGPACAARLKAFWAAYKQQHSGHQIFDPDTGNPTEHSVPLALHGDEGRGKRRTNTLIVSLEAPLGIKTACGKISKKRKYHQCCCDPPPQHASKFNQKVQPLPGDMREQVLQMRTNVKGNCFLQRWPLVVIPGVIYKAHPGLVMEFHKMLGLKLKALYHEGFLGPNGRTYFGVMLGLKADLKWHTLVAQLTRSYEHKGQVRHLACCHECMGGLEDLPWEDCSEYPVWERTMFTTRPWSSVPPLQQVPFDKQAPERFYRKDPFHIGKVGLLRDLAGSILFWCVENSYFGARGQLPDKLIAAHGAFKLFCHVQGQQPSLRSFTKALFMFKNRKSFVWANTKGSDTVLLIQWLIVQIKGFEADPLKPEDVPTLELMRRTATASMQYYDHMYAHGFFMDRKCAISLYLSGSRFLAGYNLLAQQCLGHLCLFGVKPKMHMWKHTLVEIRQTLESGAEVVANPLFWNCEGNEDAIGRLSRLSRRLDSRGLGAKVLMCFLVKGHLAYQQLHRDQNR